MKNLNEIINENKKSFYTLTDGDKDIKAFKEFLDTLSSKSHLYINLYDNRLTIQSYEDGEIGEFGILRLKKYQ